MSGVEKWVTSVDTLLAAIGDASVGRIVVSGRLTNAPSISLSPGRSLCGAAKDSTLAFAECDGVRLSSDNAIHDLHLDARPDKRAIFNDTGVATLGRIALYGVTVSGRVQILARDKVLSGHVDVNGLDIVAADARAETERPRGYGVEVLQGAFTLWNMHRDDNVALSTDLVGISVGRAGAPVRGSGIFVGGAGDTGGRLNLRRFETGAVYSDGGIAPGTPDRISGGVFVVHGAYADLVHNRGPVTTTGANDMVLDNWGTVEAWVAEDKITSHGPSGIGFVNFGVINRLETHSVIETFGQGARGFNVYTGTVRQGVFDRIVTHGDGAVGIQISQPVGEIIVRRGIETYGGVGDSLVKGVVTALSATAFSVKAGGEARKVAIAGGMVTHGAGVEPLELHGCVGALEIDGGLAAMGEGFGII